MSEIKNVYEAINHVMQQVGYVQKKKGRDLPYTFASESAFIQAIRPHMVEVGLLVYPSAMIDLPAETFTSRKGNVINITKLAMTYCFHHAPSETFFLVNVIGKGMDSGDKDANKAMTAAFKYALRQTLMIETGDDPDKEGNGKFERGAKTVKDKSVKAGDLTEAHIADYHSQATKDPVSIGPTQFWPIGHHFGIDEEQGKAIYKELGTWADALIHVVDKFGKLEAANDLAE